MASISFNGVGIVKDLELNVQRQLPYIGRLTLLNLRNQAQEDVRQWMRQNFTTPGAPVAWTTGAVQARPKYSELRLWTDVFLADDASKGNAAADYLSPQIPGNPSQAYFTRFQRRVQQLPGSHPYFFPLTNSEGTSLNANGRMRAAQYSQALYGLGGVVIQDMRRGKRNANKYKTLGKYTYVPIVRGNQDDEKIYRAFGRGRIPAPGIYKIANRSQLERRGLRHVGMPRGQAAADHQVFGIAKKIPAIQQKFNFQSVVSDSVAKNLAAAFDAAIKQALSNPR